MRFAAVILVAIAIAAGSARAWAQPWLAGNPGEDLGAQVAVADLDGDGVDDVVVSGPRFHVRGTSTNAGRVIVIRAGEDEIADRMSEWTPPTGNCKLGTALLVADLDGDSAPDLLMGAPSAERAKGRVWVVRGGRGNPAAFGGDLGRAEPMADLTGLFEGGGFGAAIAVGDLDGDGLFDLAVGEPGASPPGAQNGGRVWVFRGRKAWKSGSISGEGGDLAAGLVVLGGEGYGLGSSLAVGDVDGDGLADLVLGAPHRSRAGTPSSGSVHVLFGKKGLLGGGTHDLAKTPADRTLLGSAGGRLGAALALIDFDDDRALEILVGEPKASSKAAKEGGAVHAIAVKGMEPETDLALADRPGVTSRRGLVANEGFGASLWVGRGGGTKDQDLLIGSAGAGRVIHLEDPSDLLMRETRAVMPPAQGRGFGAACAAGIVEEGGRCAILVGAPGTSALFRF